MPVPKGENSVSASASSVAGQISSGQSVRNQQVSHWSGLDLHSLRRPPCGLRLSDEDAPAMAPGIQIGARRSLWARLLFEAAGSG